MVLDIDSICIKYPDKIYNGYIIGRQEVKISRVLVPRAKEYLEKVYINLIGLLDQLFIGYRYIISLKNNTIGLISAYR